MNWRRIFSREATPGRVNNQLVVVEDIDFDTVDLDLTSITLVYSDGRCIRVRAERGDLTLEVLILE